MALMPSLQPVRFFFFATVFVKFVSLQERKQHCPLAEELFLAEKSQALPVPAMLQGIATTLKITRETEAKLGPNHVWLPHLSNPTVIFGG